ncbi:methyl-accepting chemotaxis protein [Psychrobacillus sp. OK032]|uniref:methyl-accepting chemotaxis protein n=1 Tax=Psychrobacillus sp. OK032 TaxID=1884358 RepID=UPI0008C7BB69|nr:methyl-accepting chemotaxis protein [Psychrobacillus sp. OK032]SER97570.1 methyl-accepting chemotaxis protein [Psychrobacillus sp. OK032]
MKFKQKILMISLIPLLLSACIIGYNIIQLTALKSSTEEIVDALVKVEELNSAAKSLQKSLSAYSLNISESNKNDIDSDLSNMKSLHDSLSPSVTNKEQQVISQQLFHKYEEIFTETNKALSAQNIAEIKRQSLRTKGMQNDVIELKRSITSEYLMMQEDLQTKINGIISISIILVAFLLIGSILATFFFTNRIVHPIKQITKNAEEIAKGNLAVRLASVTTRDEIAALQNSFEQMTVNLRDVITHVSDSSNQVAASAEELMASADETMKGTELISSSIQLVSDGADQQTFMSDESARSAEESSNAVTQIAKQANAVMELSVSTNEKTKQGAEFVQETVSQMQSISTSVDETDKALIILNDRSKEIVHVLKLITDIAEQTNLLALNAAIEAARAGEAGKGFAVVADEVRKLSEQTRNSVSSISGIASEIELDTEKTVASINDVKERVNAGLEIARHTEETFHDILVSVELVKEQVSNITKVSNDINDQMVQVSTHAQEMSNVAKITADSSNSVAAASEEQLASMEEVTAAAVSLANLAEELQQRISKFTV